MDIPHGEWLLLSGSVNGEFCLKPAPALRYVTVTQPEVDRMLLVAGYHRAYAWILNQNQTAGGDGTECPALVALTENLVSPVIPGNETAFDRLIRGVRPAFLADFFDECLFMRVNLLRKRYQFQVRAGIAQIDDP